MKCFRNLKEPDETCKTCIFKGGISGPIQAQFTAWGFSRSEEEIAMLLLKGFSLREIAKYRTTTEATVRQQTLRIYQKAQVDGRHQLSGYFIGKLINPCSEST